jgi:hypothetical protein
MYTPQQTYIFFQNTNDTQEQIDSMQIHFD